MNRNTNPHTHVPTPRTSATVDLHLQKALAMATFSTTARRGTTAKPAPISELMSLKSRVSPSSVVENGGGLGTGKPAVTFSGEAENSRTCSAKEAQRPPSWNCCVWVGIFFGGVIRRNNNVRSNNKTWDWTSWRKLFRYSEIFMMMGGDTIPDKHMFGFYQKFFDLEWCSPLCPTSGFTCPLFLYTDDTWNKKGDWPMTIIKPFSHFLIRTEKPPSLILFTARLSTRGLQSATYVL